ncbi:unnamed protein product [Phytomonas sp. EM1]|nr:unnamed protein product [Phytomonas sp. EM1]|eukprot:CCW63928.1 unnamed protein product [Phytomonas sp. isolate EM1]
MDISEVTGGGPALAGAPASPIGPPSHHTATAAESQLFSHNSRKCERVDGLADDAVLDKSTEPLDESSLASELDMFDIELQKEFQAANLRSAMPSAGNHNAGIGTHTRGGGYTSYGVSSVPHASGVVRGSRGHPEAIPSTVTTSDPDKRFSSVADAYQLSSFTQDLEKSVHLIHTLAQDIRREMQIVGNGSYSYVTGHPASGSAKSGRGSPAVAPSLSTTFVEDLRLVTMVVQDINQSYHLNFGSPFSPGSAPTLGGGGAAYPPQTGLRAALPRTSPGGGRSSSCNGINNTNNGRSTIDTEVNDSLRRISYAANSPSYHHDYEVRPVNPYQAAPHGAYTIPPQAPQTQYPSQYFFNHPTTNPTATNTTGGDGASRTPTVVHYLEHVTLGRAGGANPALNPIATTNTNNTNVTGKKAIGTRNPITTTTTGKEVGGNPHAQHVAYPLAVKPQPGVTDGRGGRNRGPRSRSGKNVAPSNYSAFSECSGGETRSYKSTTTTTAFPNAHPNSSSSANATTNTSLSSAVLYPISAAILNNTGGGVGVLNGGNGGGSGGGLHGDVEGGANKGMGAGNPISGVAGVKCE